MDDGKLHPYTIEILRDVAEAKRADCKSIYHLPNRDRISINAMRTASSQLLRYGVNATIHGDSMRITWAKGNLHPITDRLVALVRELIPAEPTPA